MDRDTSRNNRPDRPDNNRESSQHEGGVGLQHSHFIVECETRILEVLTSPMGRTTLLLRRNDTRTWPKQSYVDCERDLEMVTDKIVDLDLKRDTESLTGWERQKQAA